MRYRLVVLTHGTDGRFLEESLDSFFEHVRPDPVEVYLHGDGEAAQERCYDLATKRLRGMGDDVVLGGTHEQKGFCGSCGEVWDEATAPDVDFVFWLEHDFLFTRQVDLVPIGNVLEGCPELAQMAFMRGPANADEHAAGGLYNRYRDRYSLRHGWPYVPGAESGYPFLRHRVYFTTNPSLMRREFMETNPWPDDPRECEGRFGLRLIANGYKFGVWGEGEQWVNHIGVRTGHGY